MCEVLGIVGYINKYHKGVTMKRSDGWILINRAYAERKKWAELKKLAVALGTTRDMLLDKMITATLASYDVKTTAIRKM